MRPSLMWVALLMLTSTFAGRPATAAGVTFYMSFDHWMMPDVAAGSRMPRLVLGGKLVPGKIGKALYLDGNSYLEFPAGANVGEAGGTVALWFKPEDWGAKQYDNILGFSEDQKDALHFERGHPGGQFRLVFGGHDLKAPPLERSLFSKEPLRNDEWVHLAATWDHQTGLAQMWINGQQVAAFDQPGMLPLKPPAIMVGCGFGRMSRAVRGLVDELVILDHAANAEEMGALMQGLKAGENMAQFGNDAVAVVVDRQQGTLTVGSGGESVPELLLGPASVAMQLAGVPDPFTPQRFDKEETAPAVAPRLGQGEHRVFEARDEASGALLRLHVQVQQAQPLALVWLEVANPTAQPLTVARLDVLQTLGQGGVMLGGAPDRLRVFLDNGSLCGSRSRAVKTPNASLASHGAFVVNDPEGDWGASCSFVTFQTGAVTSQLKTGQDGLPQSFTASCDYPNGYRVAPGANLLSEVLALGCHAGARLAGHQALSAWADTVMAVNDLQPPRFCPSGWNSWYCYRLTITEDLVLENARTIRDKLPGLGLHNMQIDHGWQDRNIVGNWVPNERFPHGLPWLSEQLRAMGFDLGLWTAVTQVSEWAPLFLEHPEAMLQTPEGKPLVTDPNWFWEPHGKTFSLDPTDPNGEAFYRKVGETIASYGCTYWKNDFQANLMRTDGVWHDREATEGAPIYLKAVKAYRDGAGPKVAHMACNAALNPIAGLCDAAWTHGDLGNPGARWDWLRGFWSDFCSRAHVSGKFYWSDPDYLQVGQGDDNENRVRMAFAVFGGGPMFLSDRMPELTDAKIDLIRQCLPAVGPTATPLDIFTCQDYPQVMHLPVKTDWGQWHLLGLLNLYERPTKITVDFGDLNLELGRDHLIFDYFQQRVVGEVRALQGADLLVRTPVPATDVAVLRLTPMERRPFVAGTSLHLAQGAVELQDVRWDEKALTLSGHATRPSGTKGDVFVYVPRPYQLEEGELDAARIVKVPLEFKTGECTWSVRFKGQG